MKPGHKEQGASLIETLIALSMLSLLMVVMFSIFRMGAAAWKSGEADAELAQSAQVITDRLTKEAARSALASIALDPSTAPSTAISFLSPVDPVTNLPDYDGSVGSPVWHSQSVCYYDAATKEVRWRSIPLTSPTTTASPLATLASDRTGGSLLSQEVVECEFVLLDRVVEVYLTLERKRYGKETPDWLELRSSVCFRN